MGERPETAERAHALGLKVRAYLQLLKFRLTLLVAMSAAFGYVMGASEASVVPAFMIALGGLLTTGSANVLNQILERELDKKMKRTAKRPLPQGILSNQEALVYAVVMGIGGVALIGQLFNLPAALLSIIGLLSYAFVYTPLKRITPFAVFVGAIPGALPPLIGWVAATAALDNGGLILFAFQFFWQFPHFWAIAWLLDEDYKKAGFKMLPTGGGKTQSSARVMLIYTLLLVPLSLMPLQAGMLTWPGAVMLALLAALFSVPAWKLFKTLDKRFARQLMFASFLYLPLLQWVFLMVP